MLFQAMEKRVGVWDFIGEKNNLQENGKINVCYATQRQWDTEKNFEQTGLAKFPKSTTPGFYSS